MIQRRVGDDHREISRKPGSSFCLKKFNFFPPMVRLFILRTKKDKTMKRGGKEGQRRTAMGKKYRSLGCFVGNAETGTVVPVLDPFQLTLEFFSVEKLETSSVGTVNADSCRRDDPRSVRSCLEIDVRRCNSVFLLPGSSPSARTALTNLKFPNQDPRRASLVNTHKFIRACTPTRQIFSIDSHGFWPRIDTDFTRDLQMLFTAISVR